MSTASVTWTGLSELRDALQHLPEHLADEAAGIVTEAAAHAEHDIVGGYPRRTGNLIRRVQRTESHTAAAVIAVVASRAPHANIFERGTRRRQTHRGANRGAMPVPDASEAMIPKVIRARAQMTAKLITMVRSAGFEVSA